MTIVSQSSGLPLPSPSRPQSAAYLPGYEALMAKAIPIALMTATLYLLSTAWEYVLVPWLGRTNFAPRCLFIIGCCILTLAWYSYYLARTTDAGSVPPELGEQMRLMPPELRTAENYCTKCENVKPPRAHHCKRCKKCTLRMDHHCVALNNCVGLYNWKYFISAWFYMFISCVYGIVVLVVRYMMFPEFDPETNEKFHVVIYLLLSAMLAMLSYKHANMHLNLAMLNLTSIEYMGIPAFISLNFCQRYGIAWSRISNFDKGWRTNLMQLLGEPVCMWFLPWVTPRSPWGPHPITWYSGFNVRELYAPPVANPQGRQVNAHNHETGTRNPWAMYDEPVQHAAAGLKATNLKGKGSLPLISYRDADGTTHHGAGSHSHGGPSQPHYHGDGETYNPRGHSHGDNSDDEDQMGHNHGGHGHSHGGDDHGHSHGGGHNHSHGGDDDDMPSLLSDEEIAAMHGHNHSHGGHNHSHGSGGSGHNHSH